MQYIKRTLKAKILIIFFLFLQNFLYAENLEKNAIDLIKPLKKQNCFKSKIIKEDNIFIEIENPRSWIINYIKAIEDGKRTKKQYLQKNIYLHYDPLLEKYKNKWFKVNVKYQYKFGKTCTGRGKIKLTGDFLDHFEGTNGQASFRLSLNDFSIYNNTMFKLFYPPARNNYNEVFIHEFIKIFKILSPETIGVKVKFSNFFNEPMILQEDINKEFLEKNNYREGPLIEGNEFLKLNFSEYSLKNIEKRMPYDIRYSLPKVKNSKWSIRNKSNLNQSLIALNNIKFAFFENIENHLSKDITRSEYFIFENPNYFNQKNIEKISLMNCLQELVYFPHFSVLNNKIFYFNSIEYEFEPILYDSNFDLNKSLNFNNVKYKICTSKDLENISRELVKLDTKQFLRELNKNGIEIFIKNNELEKKINKFKSILISKILKKKDNNNHFKYQKFKKTEIGNLFQRYGDYNSDKFISIAKSVNDFFICTPVMSDCEIKKYSLENIQSLLEGNLTEGEKFIQLVANYNTEKELYNEVKFLYLKGKFSKIFVDEIDKEIYLETEIPNSQVIIKNKSIKNWKINYKYIGKNKNINSENISNFLGCINIYKSQLANIDINVENCKLEDSVNIINSNGKLNSLTINEAESDAIDFDFSKLEVQEIKVINAKNDCLDMSFGKYIVKNLFLINCGDKAVSSGEKSQVIIDKGNIYGSYFGIVSKDESIVKINKVKIENTNFCLASYRKKQEFDIGTIEFNNKNLITCENQIYNWSYE